MSISASRWTMSARVGDITRPMLRVRWYSTENSLVALIPTSQSALARQRAASRSSSSVSYTHLDVYKRQVMGIEDRASGGGIFLRGQQLFQLLGSSLIRHALPGYGKTGQLQRHGIKGNRLKSVDLSFPLDNKRQRRSCLLYTSRCV